MSTKFFTNDKDNTLLKKFEGIFKHTDVFYFDALVGFFYSSGYFRLRQHLQHVSKIRILVGISVDKLIREAARKGIEFNFNSEITREEFLNELKKDIQSADYSKQVENGILEFIQDIISGKIEIKAHPNRNIHAKIYIFRQKEEHTHAGYGAVITGSSNLTQSGIETNFEFNVELRDYDDIKFATDTFETLWQEAINMIPAEIDQLKDSTYLNESFTPFEIYIKFLIEYFGKSIEYDPESITDLPKGYRKLAYQIDAVNDGYNKLLKHNGFILADVVGLGKTIIATIIAKKFYFTNGYRTKILIVHPPQLKSNWERTIRDFEVPNIHFVSNGSLHHVKHPEDYDLVIIDEAHKFRSDESEMFHQLQRLCKTKRKRSGYDGSREKKVILVTATPLNNRPDDIRNILYLFQDAKTSTLEIGNLQHFFRPLIDKYEKLKKQKDRSIISAEVKQIYEEIRVKVIEPLVVRRTRTDLRTTPEYWNDIIEQGLSFPDIIPPKQILYQLDDELNDLYDLTISLVKDTKKGLKYFRYQAIRFLPLEVKNALFNMRADVISESLADIMRILLVKRIDSSFHAFKMSLHRYQQANLAMLKMIENDRIFIAPKLNVNEFVLNDQEDELERILEDSTEPRLIHVFKREDFAEEFIKGIKHDQNVLDNLVQRWAKIERDPKLDEFIKRLNKELFLDKINDNRKLIVFSESKETTQYLKPILEKATGRKILAIDSSNQKEYAEIIRLNFDANVELSSQKDDFEIILTTEVLAEGVNLHRSNVIVNYDIPWNATRLMQRIGRVNRIGTTSERIHIYNFFPTAKTDNEIELNKKAYMKLQGFHSALGEDSQIYSTEEEFESFGLFEKIPEEDRDERLIFLQELRKFKDENREAYERIRKMPQRSRTGRKSKPFKNATITFLKNKKRDCFFFIRENLSHDELTFVEAAKIFKANVSEKSVSLHELHHEQIGVAENSFKESIIATALIDKSNLKLNPNESKAIAFLKQQSLSEFTGETDKHKIGKALVAVKKGRFQKLPREINALIRRMQKERMSRIDVFTRLMEMLSKYPLMDITDETTEYESSPLPDLVNEDLIPAIIISESFSA